ncbi:hypothetical protein [Maridesulfovibrio sp.]|uniref:hypothetical protein n=1 Tax=Maridesulfovibrio sp. TaxID=2795000 RepID=UPI002A189148|nr:hypothetical protein [Maridesulfovibrio sp.]
MKRYLDAGRDQISDHKEKQSEVGIVHMLQRASGMRLELSEDEIKKFRFYREFLKLSKNYKSLCSLINEKKKKYPFEDELIHSWCICDNYLRFPFEDWVQKAFSDEELLLKFNRDVNVKTVLSGVFPLFQDVFNDGFEDVLHRVRLFYELNNTVGLKSPDDTILSISAEAHRFYSNDDSPVFLREHSDHLMFYMDLAREGCTESIFGGHEYRYLVRINPDAPVQLIMDSFKDYLTEVCPKSATNSRIAATKPFYTTGKLQFEKYSEVLAFVHSQTKYKTKREAIEKTMDTDFKKCENYDTRKKTYYNKLNKAKEYIHQAECGIFPDAGKVSDRKKKVKKPCESEYAKIAHLVEAKKKAKEASFNKDLSLNDFVIRSEK